MFDHIFIDHQAPKTLILLHGTGGNKSDFLFLDQLLDRSFNLLGIQGNVLENGMPRFFKRNSFGIFDQDNLRQEAEKLHQFITHWGDDHNLTTDDLAFLGYSNGANMILASLFYYPNDIKTAALLHPMLPFTPPAISLKGSRFFVSAGLHDQMISLDQSQMVVETLKEKGAELVVNQYPGGHEISHQEIQDVAEFLKNLVS